MSAIRVLALITITLAFSFACSSSSDEKKSDNSGGSSTTTSTSKSCSKAFACGGSACKCTDGPKKDQDCCNPDDASCKGTENACDKVCLVCTDNPPPSSTDTSPAPTSSEPPPGG